MQQKYYLSCHDNGFHRLAYTEWNANNNKRTVICVHGFARNSRDFDMLAQELQKDFRVICVDIAGHGKSDRLSPEHYKFQQFVHDLCGLIARLDVEQVDWIGSSLGGRMGIALASYPQSPIRKLILNDVGPIFGMSARTKITDIIIKERTFQNLGDAGIYYRKVLSQMGPMTEDNWQDLTVNSVVEGSDGLYRLAYDPNILLAKPRRASKKTWFSTWQNIKCPIYLLHGETSTILTPQIVNKMLKTQPHMKVVHIPGVGHMPSLMDQHQIAVIKGWLNEK